MAKKILRCKFKKEWNGYTIKQYTLHDLWPSVAIVEKHLRVNNKIKNKRLGKFQSKNEFSFQKAPKPDYVFDFKKKLQEDIEKNGLYFPVLVVKLSYKQISDRQAENEEKGIGHFHATRPFWHEESQREDKFLLCLFGGSQRVNLAKEMGYTHIDGISVPDVKTSYDLQFKQNKEYQKTLYGGGGVTVEQLDINGNPTRAI
jgi:hypothetical protein